VSVADRGAADPGLPAGWERLERAAQDASVAVAGWTRRAAEAEDEVARLQRSLEQLAAGGEAGDDVREELRRLRAENALLRSRVAQARKRIGALLKRMDTLGSQT
jgi:predicted nuclease with TOPRIM domain